MQRKIIAAVLVVLCVFLAYKLWDTIDSELKYQKEVQVVENNVKARLKKIREVQLIYKDEKGKFAANFDSLERFIRYDSMTITQQYGDKDDSTTQFIQKIERISIQDSLFKDYPIDSLSIAPHSNKKFIMEARIIDQNNVTVPVFEVKDPAPFSRERKEDDNPLKVGSLTEASYQGNWD